MTTIKATLCPNLLGAALTGSPGGVDREDGAAPPPGSPDGALGGPAKIAGWEARALDQPGWLPAGALGGEGDAPSDWASGVPLDRGPLGGSSSAGSTCVGFGPVFTVSPVAAPAKTGPSPAPFGATWGE
jgi:hypothetical protein